MICDPTFPPSPPHLRTVLLPLYSSCRAALTDPVRGDLLLMSTDESGEPVNFTLKVRSVVRCGRGRGRPKIGPSAAHPYDAPSSSPLQPLSRARSGPRPCSLSQQEYDDFAALDIDPDEEDEDDENDDDDEEEDEEDDGEEDAEDDGEDDDGMGDEEGMQALL